jgi:hypothetical protein
MFLRVRGSVVQKEAVFGRGVSCTALARARVGAGWASEVAAGSGWACEGVSQATGSVVQKAVSAYPPRAKAIVRPAALANTLVLIHDASPMPILVISTARRRYQARHATH